MSAALRVLEIFDSLQGEGYWTGAPMTFVRLAGCNAPDLGLDCVRWCDTKDSWPARAGEDFDIEAIVERVTYPRMCLTGGEPLLQCEGVAALLDAAHARGIRVHVETNGTIGPEWPPAGSAEAGRGGAGRGDTAAGGAGAPAGWAGLGSGAGSPAASLEFDWAVVSPKPPDYVIAPGWGDLIDELKLVADEGLDTATAERLAARAPRGLRLHPTDGGAEPRRRPGRLRSGCRFCRGLGEAGHRPGDEPSRVAPVAADAQAPGHSLVGPRSREAGASRGRDSSTRLLSMRVES